MHYTNIDHMNTWHLLVKLLVLKFQRLHNSFKSFYYTQSRSVEKTTPVHTKDLYFIYFSSNLRESPRWGSLILFQKQLRQTNGDIRSTDRDKILQFYASAKKNHEWLVRYSVFTKRPTYIFHDIINCRKKCACILTSHLYSNCAVNRLENKINPFKLRIHH